MREWQIGDPVDDAHGAFMDAQNWGHGYSEDDEDNTSHDYRSDRDSYSNRAWKLYMDYNKDEALRYINLALDLDPLHANNWNRKAIILEAMQRYAQSEECYNRSLELSPQNLVYDNKARMLYNWAVNILEISKNMHYRRIMLGAAYDKIIKAIIALPGEKSEENRDKYIKLRDSINNYMDYEDKYQSNLETLKKYDKNELFTITGMNFYKNNVTLTSGKPLRLVKEPDNEFDKDAIAVYADNEKIGYVANSDYTAHELTSKASGLQDKLPKVTKTEYLLYLDRYGEMKFYIGRILK